MAEENTTTEQNEATNEEAVKEGADGGRSAQKTLSRRAARSLRRARQTYQNNGWQDSGEAAFLLREANILALMDVAEAVREMQNSREEGPSG
jgi:hypothetical protein